MVDKIKKHPLATLTLALFIVFIIALAIFKGELMLDTSKPDYGNRLDRTSKVKIEDSTITKFKDGVKQNKEVEDISYRLSGNTVNIIIYLNSDTNKDRAHEIGNSTLNYFSDDIKEVYSFQCYLAKKDKTKEDFPIVGYKHFNNPAYSWTKDR